MDEVVDTSDPEEQQEISLTFLTRLHAENTVPRPHKRRKIEGKGLENSSPVKDVTSSPPKDIQDEELEGSQDPLLLVPKIRAEPLEESDEEDYPQNQLGLLSPLTNSTRSARSSPLFSPTHASTPDTSQRLSTPLKSLPTSPQISPGESHASSPVLYPQNYSRTSVRESPVSPREFRPPSHARTPSYEALSPGDSPLQNSPPSPSMPAPLRAPISPQQLDETRSSDDRPTPALPIGSPDVDDFPDIPPERRYSLRTRTKQQEYPYKLDQLLYEKQMSRNPEAIVHAEKERRRKRREEYEETQDDGYEEDEDTQKQQRKSREKSRSVTEKRDDEKGFYDNDPLSQDPEDEFDPEDLREARRAMKEKARKEKEAQRLEREIEKRKAEKGKEKARPRPVPRWQKELNPHKTMNGRALESRSWDADSSPVAGPSTSRRAISASRSDAMDVDDNDQTDFAMQGDDDFDFGYNDDALNSPARPVSPIVVDISDSHSPGGSDRSSSPRRLHRLSRSRSKSHRPTSPFESSSSSSGEKGDEDSADERRRREEKEERRRRKALKRMLPHSMHTGAMKKTSFASQQHQNHHQADDEAGGELRPGQTKTRKSGKGYEKEVKGDEESEDEDAGTRVKEESSPRQMMLDLRPQDPWSDDDVPPQRKKSVTASSSQQRIVELSDSSSEDDSESDIEIVRVDDDYISRYVHASDDYARRSSSVPHSARGQRTRRGTAVEVDEIDYMLSRPARVGGQRVRSSKPRRKKTRKSGTTVNIYVGGVDNGGRQTTLKDYEHEEIENAPGRKKKKKVFGKDRVRKRKRQMDLHDYFDDDDADADEGEAKMVVDPSTSKQREEQRKKKLEKERKKRLKMRDLHVFVNSGRGRMESHVSGGGGGRDRVNLFLNGVRKRRRRGARPTPFEMAMEDEELVRILDNRAKTGPPPSASASASGQGQDRSPAATKKEGLAKRREGRVKHKTKRRLAENVNVDVRVQRMRDGPEAYVAAQLGEDQEGGYEEHRDGMDVDVGERTRLHTRFDNDFRGVEDQSEVEEEDEVVDVEAPSAEFIDMGIRPPEPAFTLPALATDDEQSQSSLIKRGKVKALLSLLPSETTSETAEPETLVAFGCSIVLGGDTSAEQFLKVFKKLCEDLIEFAVSLPDADEYEEQSHEWERVLASVGTYVSYSSARHQAVRDDIQVAISGVIYAVKDAGFTKQSMDNLTLRLVLFALETQIRIQGSDIDEAIELLVRLLLEFGIEDVMAAYHGQESTSVSFLAMELWILALHVLDQRDGLHPRQGSSRSSVWNLTERFFSEKLKGDENGLEIVDDIWRTLFGIACLAHFSPEGVAQSPAAITLSSSWNMAELVLSRVSLAQKTNETISLNHQAARDILAHITVHRCYLLRSVWQWPIENVKTIEKVLFSLMELFRSRRHADLSCENTDFPAFMRENNWDLLKEEARPKDTSFALLLKLVYQTSMEPGSSLNKMKVLSILVPTSSLNFTKANHASEGQLSMLYNRISATALAIYLDSDKYQSNIEKAKAYVKIEDADDTTRHVLFRGLMYLALVLIHFEKPLDSILDWLGEMIACLKKEAFEGDCSKKDIAAFSLVNLMAASRQVVAGYEGTTQYPEIRLLMGFIPVLEIRADIPWIIVHQFQRLLSTFLDVREVLLSSIEPQPGLATEESQDYDFGDNDYRRLVDRGTVTDKEKELAEELHKTIYTALPKVSRCTLQRLSSKLSNTLPYILNGLKLALRRWLQCVAICLNHGLTKSWLQALELPKKYWQAHCQRPEVWLPMRAYMCKTAIELDPSTSGSFENEGYRAYIWQTFEQAIIVPEPTEELVSFLAAYQSVADEPEILRGWKQLDLSQSSYSEIRISIFRLILSNTSQALARDSRTPLCDLLKECLSVLNKVLDDLEKAPNPSAAAPYRTDCVSIARALLSHEKLKSTTKLTFWVKVWAKKLVSS